MKYRQTVWLPPDGDNRLTVLQESLAHSFGRWEFLARPPYLVVPSGDLSRSFPLVCGAWRTGTPGLELEVWAGGVLLGGLCFSEAWSAPDFPREGTDLPPPPTWSWKKGKLAVMSVDLVAGQVSVEWSLQDVKGWKVVEPKR